MRESIPISEFERIVKDAAFDRFGGVRVFRCAAGAKSAPADTCTFVFGAWENGDWMNVTTPDVPENNVHIIAEEAGRTYRRLVRFGWRALLMDMIASGYIRITPEVRSMLGESSVDRAILSGGRKFL